MVRAAKLAWRKDHVTSHALCVLAHTEHIRTPISAARTTPGSLPSQPAGAHLMHAGDARLHHGPPWRADLAHAAHAGHCDGAGREVARQRVSGRPCTAHPTSPIWQAAQNTLSTRCTRWPLRCQWSSSEISMGQARLPVSLPRSLQAHMLAALCKQDYVLCHHHTRLFSRLCNTCICCSGRTEPCRNGARVVPR